MVFVKNVVTSVLMNTLRELNKMKPNKISVVIISICLFIVICCVLAFDNILDKEQIEEDFYWKY